MCDLHRNSRGCTENGMFKMNKKENSYIIPITGLSVGYREYQYVIDDSFFEMFDYSEVRKGLVSVNLGILKQESSFK